jgi:hypothetical protein
MTAWQTHRFLLAFSKTELYRGSSRFREIRFFVLCDFGPNIGKAYVETDPEKTDRETILNLLMRGEYHAPLHVRNTADGTALPNRFGAPFLPLRHRRSWLLAVADSPLRPLFLDVVFFVCVKTALHSC